MSTAIAMAPSPAPHERDSLVTAPTSTAAPTANGASSPTSHRSTPASRPATAQTSSQKSGSRSPRAPASSGKASPATVRSKVDGSTPKVVIKKEPGSPTLGNARPRPRRLDLSKNTLNSNSPASALPLTARDSLGIQEVGLACLSPGFVTQDPVMNQQLQRSLSVREQQRNIIEARLQQQSAKGDGTNPENPAQFSAKTPGMSSHRKRAPPGLSIVAPSHEQFAHERVIQSAPLGHSFTGRHQPAPLSRHVPTRPGNSSQSHIHHVPATQTNNRLPPIHDVFSQAHHAEPQQSSVLHQTGAMVGGSGGQSLPPNQHHYGYGYGETAVNANSDLKREPGKDEAGADGINNTVSGRY
ncbi:hypothetical protein NQ176_g5358 [Zarea fungicola]|uniref:Uncharacterized protein n=1 Tax=Zarea fungicola TaxID=93591 RepID=A0ACC1N8W4_9HYPO|nr:hypothetical protein NQ176_g5358 [Lecanicillium fungicola]